MAKEKKVVSIVNEPDHKNTLRDQILTVISSVTVCEASGLRQFKKERVAVQNCLMRPIFCRGKRENRFAAEGRDFI